MPRLHGEGLVRSEAVPADLHGVVRRRRCSRLRPTRRRRGGTILAEHPDSTGSLGIAISEAVEVAATNDDTHYALGSVLNHVLLHQTVIGLEAKEQMEMAGEVPDVVIGCVGRRVELRRYRLSVHGGQAPRASRPTMRFLAAEPAACPTLTKGSFAYDFGDTAGMTPLLPMYTLGHDFVPAPVHAGGLRYHGDAPSLSLLVKHGHMEARRLHAEPDLRRGDPVLARRRGSSRRPSRRTRSSAAIEEAEAAEMAGEERVILFNLCGHGHFDMQAYDDYLNGRLPEVEFEDAQVADALASLPKVPIAG